MPPRSWGKLSCDGYLLIDDLRGRRIGLVDRPSDDPFGSIRCTTPGVWPGGEHLVWTNIADRGDVVALEKGLRPRFGNRLRNIIVHNGAHAHDVTAYLTDACTGDAIAGGLHAR